MCGIVGMVSSQQLAEPVLLQGLKCLEYRGYDSAGMATCAKGQLHITKALGKIDALASVLAHTPSPGSIGIAHTRWATHGVPNEDNAHPHVSRQHVAVVHNGIIENHVALKQMLEQSGYVFVSDTDTEVVAHLFHQIQKEKKGLASILELKRQLKGSFALALLNQEDDQVVWGVREGSPLVVGIGKGTHYLASDPMALLSETRTFVYLEEGDSVSLSPDAFQIYDAKGMPVTREFHVFEKEEQSQGLSGYRHYMQKEMFEQPQAIEATLQSCFSEGGVNASVFGAHAASIFSDVKRVHMVACGTSYHAGLVAQHFIESFVGLPCRVSVASEYRYTDQVVEPNTLFVTISQSGETADTLAALQKAKQQPYVSTLAICNVSKSTLVRESELVFLTQAGAEIGVASTKAFTTQLLGLYVLSLALAENRPDELIALKESIHVLQQASAGVADMLKQDDAMAAMAMHFANKAHALFLGRGAMVPIAQEGALKLKEISYIHAEAYPAGELKHGPLALVDTNMPVVALVPFDPQTEKLLSNLQEVKARGGLLFVVADERVKIPFETMGCVKVKALPPVLMPLVYTVGLQLLAYHVAVLKGTDVDRPRNLAKSVTVE